MQAMNTGQIISSTSPTQPLVEWNCFVSKKASKVATHAVTCFLRKEKQKQKIPARRDDTGTTVEKGRSTNTNTYTNRPKSWR